MAELQARFSELQDLLVQSKEAHEMYDRLSSLPTTDAIYIDIAASHKGKRNFATLVQQDVEQLTQQWSDEVDELDERINEIRDLLHEAGYDIDDWIVRNFTMKDVADAESSVSAKRLRSEVDAKLEKERPVSHVEGNETHVRPIGASGYFHAEYDEKEEDQASVDELDEVKEKDLERAINDKPPDKLNIFSAAKDKLEIEDPEHVYDSGAVWENGYRVIPELVDTLKDYQLDCVSHIIERMCDNKGYLVAHGMGLGKTMTVIAALSTLATGGTLHAIVACPASMIFPWCAEVDKWMAKGIVDISAYPVEKSDAFAREHSLWLRNGGMLILSHEMLKRSLQQLNQDARVTSNMVLVFDEAHLLKSPNTQLYQAVDGMPTERRILLTGTPLQNHLKEYFAMVHLMTPGLLGTKMSEFNKTYGADIERGMLKESTDDEIAKSKRAVVRLKKTVEDVMHSVPSSILKEMLPKKIEFRLLHKVAAEVSSSDGGVIAERHELHAAALMEKTILTIELIDAIGQESEDDAIVVFSPYVDILAACEKTRTGFIITGEASPKDRDDTIKKFRAKNDGQKILYVSTGAGGVGVDFSVANRVIVTDASWNPAVDMQAIARAWRMGQTKTTFVYRLIGHQTLEERILRMQVQKTSLAMRVMEEQEITRFYSKLDLSQVTAEVEDEKILKADDVAKVDPCLAAVLTSSDSEFNVSSHDAMFLDEEVALSAEEMSRAMNEMTESMFDKSNVRQFTMNDGTTQTVNGWQTFFRAPYDTFLVPPYKPLSVKCELTDDEIDQHGKFKAKFHPEVIFDKDTPLWMCFGPSFPPEASDPYELEVMYQMRRRWEQYPKFSAHVDSNFKRLYYKLKMPPGSYKFKVRFVGKKRVSEWSDESELVTVK